MFTQPDPHSLPFLSKPFSFSSPFSRTSKAHSLSSRHFKTPSVSLQSKAMIFDSKPSNHTVTVPSLLNGTNPDRFDEAGDELADAAGEVIRGYIKKKFEILDTEGLDPETIADQAAEEMVCIIIDNLCSLAVCSASPNLLGGDANQAFARVGEKVEALLNGRDGYTYALLASCFVDLVVESGLQGFDVAAGDEQILPLDALQ